ncbi:MAG: hypothetical protein OEL79_08735 [Chromatiales bacterium]|nr:hypothetical protein [Chromatiales bacterium]
MSQIKKTLNNSLQSSWVILKLVIPIYILADVLYFYNTLSYVAFMVEPFTSILGLPPEASMAIISGMFLNLYAAVAFAAPLDLSPQQWSILAVYLGICHSLIVESLIMKKIGISNIYSYLFRFISALLVAYLTTLIPASWFETADAVSSFEKTTYDSLTALFIGSFFSAIILSAKIIALVTTLIFIMDFIKSRPFMRNSHKNIAPIFSLITGIFLGITYGAAVLIKEAEALSKYQLFFIATFLMVCHAIIEDTLLFVIFGADFTLVIAIRTVAAIILSFVLLSIYRYADKS